MQVPTSSQLVCFLLYIIRIYYSCNKYILYMYANYFILHDRGLCVLRLKQLYAILKNSFEPFINLYLVDSSVQCII